MRHAGAMAIVTALMLVTPALAGLPASHAFTLLQKTPPGEDYLEAKKFLGVPSAERTADAKGGIKITRWGKKSEGWTLEVLHNGEVVRAARVTWTTKSKAEQHVIFSQLTSAGRNFFGRPAAFKGAGEAQWDEPGDGVAGRWIVRAAIESGIARGVTLLSGIRDSVVSSERFGF